ncbi:MAG: hypothetical protein ORN49_11095 [Rhodobacteraceae bacterium]|nr:hypothetical protein [Paracoccaceae bacterium]
MLRTMAINGNILIILAISAILCLPPYLALRMFMKSYQRAARRGLPTGRFYVAIALMLVAFMFNMGVLIGGAIAFEQGTLTFVHLHVIALAIAWISFWIWLFLGLALGRNLGRKHGLR